MCLSQHLNKERTSTNAWCVEDCYEDNTTQAVIKRLENITGIPDTNSEYLQLLRVRHLNIVIYQWAKHVAFVLLLRSLIICAMPCHFFFQCAYEQYEVGQKYGVHHDYIEYVSDLYIVTSKSKLFDAYHCTCDEEWTKVVALPPINLIVF